MGAGIKFFLESSAAPVLSCEIAEKFHRFCQARFAQERRVRLFHGASVEFLENVNAPELSPTAPVLIYLDAHWGTDLPLAREMEIIQQRWPEALVVIDDFKVPHDSGYGFDEYGKGKSLDATYLANLKKPLQIYYPALASSLETGARRGCCFACMPGTKAAGLLAARPDYFIT